MCSSDLNALSCTDAVAHMPVLRPLIGMDKTEIVEIARKIDTFDTSILPYEDCCTVFTPRHPKLRPHPDEVSQVQAEVDFAPLIEKAIAGTTKKIFAQHVSESRL